MKHTKFKRLGKLVLTMSCCIALNACSIFSKQPSSNNYPPLSLEIASPPGSILTIHNRITERDLFTLTSSQQARFKSFYQQQLSEDVKPHVAIANYLEKHLDKFNYYGDTLSAAVSLSEEKGNCMSLAIVTTALARLVDLQIDYKLVLSDPIYDKKSGVITYSRHVQSRIFDPTFKQERGKMYLGKPHAIIDYFPRPGSVTGKFIKHHDFMSLYFQNMAAESLIQEDLQKAYYFAFQAYQLTEYDADALNMLAVTSRRLGLNRQAESIYQHLLLIDDSNLLALNNYHMFLLSLGRLAEAAKIKSRLAFANDPNPFYLIAIGDKYLKERDLGNALKFYDKAISRAPYLVEPYKRAINILNNQGRHRRAHEYLNLSLDWIQRPSERKALKHKLYGQSQYKSN